MVPNKWVERFGYITGRIKRFRDDENVVEILMPFNIYKIYKIVLKNITIIF